MNYFKCKFCNYKLKRKIKMINDQEESEEYQLDKLRDHYEFNHPDHKLPNKNVKQFSHNQIN